MEFFSSRVDLNAALFLFPNVLLWGIAVTAMIVCGVPQFRTSWRVTRHALVVLPYLVVWVSLMGGYAYGGGLDDLNALAPAATGRVLLTVAFLYAVALLSIGLWASIVLAGLTERLLRYAFRWLRFVWRATTFDPVPRSSSAATLKRRS